MELPKDDKKMIRRFRKLSEGRRLSLKEEFALAVAMTAMLVLLEQWALWAMVRYTKRAKEKREKASGR